MEHIEHHHHPHLISHRLFESKCSKQRGLPLVMQQITQSMALLRAWLAFVVWLAVRCFCRLLITCIIVLTPHTSQLLIDLCTQLQGLASSHGAASSSRIGMDAAKRLEGLPPPPPAGSTKAPPVQEQRERIREAMEEAHVMRPGDVFFPVSAIWWDHWRRFVDQDGDGQAAQAEAEEGGARPAAPAQGHHHHVQQARSGDEELHPGRMDNTALAAEEGSRELSREVRDDPLLGFDSLDGDGCPGDGEAAAPIDPKIE